MYVPCVSGCFCICHRGMIEIERDIATETAIETVIIERKRDGMKRETNDSLMNTGVLMYMYSSY